MLVQLDVTTGALVPDAFGPGIDYVLMPAIAGLGDADDLAIDPADGQLYAIFNTGGGTDDRLVRVDKQTGATSDVGPIGVPDVEGLAFGADGVLWATNGSAQPVLFEVDKNTGASFNSRPLNQSSDYEGVECFTVPSHDLQVTVGVSDALPRTGETITLTIEVQNNGPHDALTVSLDDLLPPGLGYQSHDAQQGSYDSGTGAWTIGDLPIGASTTLTITVTVDAAPGTTVTNTATDLVGYSQDPVPGNNTDSVELTVDASPDSDNDGLFDGTELGIDMPHPDTDESAGNFIPDADPTTMTDPLDPDTDDGTVSDGDEDSNHNGAVDVDEGERDPNNPADDIPDSESDRDGDGVPDSQDNCPDTANTTQPDLDNDGLGDDCDPDADGNGFDDTIGAAGGGCAAGGSSSPGAALLLLGLLALVQLATRRARRPGRAAAALALLLLAASPAARAQSASVDSDYTVERFRLSLDRGGVLDVESGAVLPHLAFDLGLWLGYANDPLTLYRADGDGSDRERVGGLVSHRVGGNLVGSVGLFDRVQLGLDIPLILSQDQDLGMTMAPSDALSSFGLGDLRLIPKVQLLNAADHGVDLSVLVGFTLPTSSSSDYFGDSGATFVPELAVSRPFTPRLRGGVNLGYRARAHQQTLDLAVDDELYAHMGAGYMVTRDVELDGTLALATSASDPFGSFNRNYTELRGGAAYYFARMVTFASAGFGLSEGFGGPDWRALVGMRFGRRPPPPEEPPAVVVAPPPPPPDSDGDGLTDPDDACPQQPEDMDAFQDQDGCPDPDNDQDGILDTADACVEQPGPVENRGCPDTDRDQDTVVDRLDNCPDEPGAPENQGCANKQLVVIGKDKLEILDRVFFRTNRDVILPRSFGLLDNVAQVIASHPEIQLIQVEGHTDDRGNDAYNKDLSQRRAQAVVDYLVRKGVARERLQPIGYGEEKPIAPNDTPANRAANRRVDFNLIGAEGAIEIDKQNSGPGDDAIDN